jgi:DNA-binding GntR family transcriptional regulator
MSAKLRATVERQTLAEQVYTSLKKAIVSGDLQPGERLKELEIARSLGASRTPVREAMSWLEQEGLLQPLRSGGLTVVELSEVDVEEIFGLIQVLESYASRLAAERVSEKQLERMEAVCQRAEELSDDERERLSELNWKFHELLIEAADNRRLQDLIRNLRSAMQPYRAVTLTSDEFRGRSVADHREMIALLRAKAGDRVERLMFEHIGIARRVTLAGLRDRADRLASET